MGQAEKFSTGSTCWLVQCPDKAEVASSILAPWTVNEGEVVEPPGCEPGLSGFKSRRSPHSWWS